MPPKDEILKIRISDKLKKEAKEFAESEGETLAVITRLALKEYIEKKKERNAFYGTNSTIKERKAILKKVGEAGTPDENES
jgi:predicted transcriptional regulator